MARDPTSLTHVEAAALLLPHRLLGNRSAVDVWPPWEEPRDAKKIDAQITGLNSRRNGLKPYLRTKEELAAIGIPCPYLHAREAVVYGAGDGRDQVEERLHSRNKIAPDLIALAERAGKLEREIVDFIAEYRRLNFWPIDGRRQASRLDIDNLNSRLDASNTQLDKIRTAPEGLSAVAKILENSARKIAPHGSDGDVWGQAFSERLGYAWRNLTGCDPSPGGGSLFVQFVKDGFSSLGGVATKPRSWVTSIKTTCQRVAALPDWDRWDRVERRTRPPGEGPPLPQDWFQQRQRERRARLEAAVLALADARTDEEGQRAYSALLHISPRTLLTEAGIAEMRRIVEAREAMRQSRTLQ